jgi:anthranilate phosphoribosyltransferase
MQGFVHGQSIALQEHQGGSLATLPELPQSIDATSTANYIRQVLDGKQPVPTPIAQQVAHILHMGASL